MKDNKIGYSLIVILIIFLIFSLTIINLKLKKEVNGSLICDQNYYDIIFSNVDVNDNAEIKIKDNIINVYIDNIKENNKISFLIDINNIGNLNAVVDSVYIDNIISKIPKNDVIINTSIEKDEIIMGGQAKKLLVEIEYIGNNELDNYNYKFDLNYLFKEVNL